jgi:hypothetical protein
VLPLGIAPKLRGRKPLLLTVRLWERKPLPEIASGPRVYRTLMLLLTP